MPATETRKVDRRSRYEPIELREDGDSPVLEGHAIRFGVWSQDLGGFQEQIAPTAFDAVLAESSDVHAYRNHDSNQILGRQGNNTLEIFKDEIGIGFRLSLDDTTYAQDTLKSVRRGDISGMSFGFIATRDEWDRSDDEMWRRTVLEISYFPEISVVTNPAYLQTDVSAALRSLEAAQQDFRNSQTWRASYRHRQLQIEKALSTYRG